ncbi:MAG: magnesium transporter [Candidatus Bathyarchaeota archaeon]|nr:magnesium transporter [Candidatus Bathyarchaeota archaeon]MDH5745878.1 magnesium transporter [Candidatus Bathyarchaeota archaeon]
MTVRTSITGLIASLGQSLLSLSFNLGGILAGTLIVLYFSVFDRTPIWTLALLPGILSIRGAIGGLFSGRLSTGLHLGTVKPSYVENTREFYLLFYAVVTLTLESSVVVGLVASLFNVVLWGASIVDCVSIIVVVVSTMGLSIIFISPITIGVSVVSFRRGLDPDVIVYPVMSTVADILVTVCYILELNIFFLFIPLGRYLIGFSALLFLLVVSYVLAKHGREDKFVKTIKEFFVTLVLVAFIVNVTGSFLNSISGVIGRRPEVYVVYPALIDTVGDVGSIVGSTATTKLFLGVTSPSFSSIKQHSTRIGGAWGASMMMFTLYSVLPFTQRITTLNNLPGFVAQLLMTNILAVSAMVVIAYAVAIFTYRRGWDPDNFVIPIESSLADSITTVSFLAALSAIG